LEAWSVAPLSAISLLNGEEAVMHRRDLFKAGGASLAALATPRIGPAERASKLVFVPAVDLSVLDPVITGLRSDLKF
jgi:hypothetical protein